MATNKRLIKSNDEAAGGASFNTVTYTGNGTTQSITGVGFQPDFTWIKVRTVTDNNVLQDSVRGVGKGLFSDLTNAENASMGGMTSFDSDGFTFDGSISTLNGSGRDFVAWNFKAGGAAVTNTDGTITSQVSANTEAGFSIVSYTGNLTGGATVGHGLNTAPDFVVCKSRTSVGGWPVVTTAIPSTQYLVLNYNSPAETENIFNNTYPSDTVFTLGPTTFNNASGQDYIAYCFAEVAGFSKFGSYTGGTANNSITLGFEPAFVMIKSYSGVAEQWVMYDNKRSTSNPRNDLLFANLPNSESVNNVNQEINFDANGFTLVTTNSATNVSGASYIYMAFANQF